MNTVTELPFNMLLNLQSATDAAHLLWLPAGGQYLNHLGTVHAGVLVALAEATSGEFLPRTLGDATGVVPVVRRLEAKFRKPANGAVTSSATVAEGALDQLRDGLAAKGRGLISVNVELHDESGAHVLSAFGEWFISTAPARL